MLIAEIEGKDGRLWRIKEVRAMRCTTIENKYGTIQKEIKLPYYNFDIYEYIAGVQMYKIKSFRVGHIDSPHYQSEKQKAFEKAYAWIQKQ